MLTALADRDGLTASDKVRQLIRREHAQVSPARLRPRSERSASGERKTARLSSNPPGHDRPKGVRSMTDSNTGNGNGRGARRGRPRKGSLAMRGKTWHARLTMTVDGESVRRWFDLGTDNRSAARRKLARILAGQVRDEAPSAEAARAPETVASYAATWMTRAASAVSRRWATRSASSSACGSPRSGDAARRGDGFPRSKRARRRRDGSAASEKRKGQTTEPKPYSRQSVAHIRATIFRLFDAAWRDELIPENRVARVSVPEMVETRKPRAVLTDAEVGELVGHPRRGRRDQGASSAEPVRRRHPLGRPERPHVGRVLAGLRCVHARSVERRGASVRRRKRSKCRRSHGCSSGPGGSGGSARPVARCSRSARALAPDTPRRPRT